MSLPSFLSFHRLTGAGLFVFAFAFVAAATLTPNALLHELPFLAGLGSNTALCIGLLGLALATSSDHQNPRWVVVYAVAAALAITSLLQYVLGIYPADSLWRLLFNTTRSAGAWQGRMSVPSASIIGCFSAAGFLLATRQARLAPAVYLAIGLGMLIALSSFSGHLVGLVIFVHTRPDAGYMSPASSLPLIIAGAAAWQAAGRRSWVREWHAQAPSINLFIQAAGLLAMFLVIGSVGAGGLMLEGHYKLATTIILVLATIGAAWLYWRIVPVVKRIHQAETDLRAVSRQQELLLNHAGQGIYGLDSAGCITFANPAAAALLGYDANDLIGRPMHPLLHYRRRDGSPYPEADCPIRATLLDGVNRHVEDEVFWHRDGRPLAVEYDVAALREDARISGAVVMFSDVGERLRLLEDLSRWKQIFEHADWGVAIGDADNATLALVNPALARMHGYSVEELQGRPIADLVAPDARAGLAETFRQIHSRGHLRIDTQHLRKDGQVFNVLVDATAVRNESGRVLYHVVNVIDTTEQVEREEQLRRSEATLRLTLEHLPVGVWLADAEGNIILANPAGQAIWRGVEHVPIERFNVYEGWWADSGKKLEAHDWALARAIEKGETSLEEVINIRCFDGSLKTILNSALPLLDANGRLEGAVVINQDITIRQRQDLALRRSEASLALAQAQVHLGSWWLDIPNNLLQWSDENYRIFGIPVGTTPLTYDTFMSCVHPDDRAYVDEKWRASMAGEPYDIQHRLLVNGQVKWVRERAELEFHADGTLWRGVGTTQDITAAKQEEEELLRSRQKLRELAAHHEKIREAERSRIAREVHDELGQYLTALRMDAAVLGIRFGARDPELDLLARGMKDTIDTTIGMVRNVVAALRPGALDMGLVSAAEWLLAGFEERTGIVCHLKAPADIPGLDDTRTTAAFRILQESLTNVMRHAQAGQVWVNLTCSGQMLSMRISDDGIGFDFDTVARRKTFGLMGIRERALMFGGKSWIDSHPDVGTSLSVLIPLQDTPAAQPPEMSES